MIRRHDAYVNDVQRFGTIIKILEVRGEPSPADDEIAELSARVISLTASQFFSGERNRHRSERPAISRRST